MIWELCTVRVAAYMLLVVSLPVFGCAVASAQETGTPPQQQGTVTGRVLDKGTSDPIIEAGVEVVDLGKKTRTDLDGNFKLQLAPGTYQLRFFAPLYQGTRLQNVIVKPNQVTKTDVTLVAQGQAGVQVVEVVAQADKAAEATQLLQRKKAAVVSDTIAAETITKSPDRTAAEVVKRVPAVTIQNGKFVFVRGLGERYSSALLDGSRLPSTDPSKRVVPLDLFPAEFIESLNILKSYTPDLPGDFSGGLVDIRLREFPDRLTYTIGLTTGANSNATFQRFQTYEGSDWDYLGLGAGFRSRAADNTPDLTNLPPQANGKLQPAQERFFASKFHNIWSPESTTAPPNFGANFSIGDTIGPLGVSFGAIYNTEYLSRPDEFQQNFTHKGNPPHVVIVTDADLETLTFDRSTFATRLGAVLTAGYKLGDNHKLSLRTLVDRNSADEVIDGTGNDRNLNTGDPIRQWQLRYKEEQLGYGQLAGEHHLPFLDINWRTALSQTTETEPDTRLITYDTATSLLATGGPESSERVFSNLDEYLTDSAVDLTVPFKTALPFTDIWSGLPAKFKFGPAYAFRHRNFHYRRFVYGLNPSGSAPPEVLLAPDNIPTTLSFRENARKSDSFTANQEIAAMYGMFDLPLIQDRLRLVAGVRVEYSYIITDGADLALGQPLHTTINDLSALPGANLIYSVRDDMNLRYAYSRSTSRPEFRELTPTRFVVPNGERPVIGNPTLTSADIEGHDLRWEWFFSPAELVSFGVFYKQLTNPIEQTVGSESAGETDSFKNAKDATLRGLEFEARKNLSIISRRLSNFSLLTNVAYIDSQANIPINTCGFSTGVPCEVQTSTKRALQGQAEYIVNAAVEYTHPVWGTARIFYNTLGPRIVAAGADGLPDITEHPRNQLDLVLLAPIKPFGTPLTAKLSAENLLDDPFVQTQAGYTAHRYTTGVKMGIGLSYTY
jgi:hypothetical protein